MISFELNTRFTIIVSFSIEISVQKLCPAIEDALNLWFTAQAHFIVCMVPEHIHILPSDQLRAVFVEIDNRAPSYLIHTNGSCCVSSFSIYTEHIIMHLRLCPFLVTCFSCDFGCLSLTCTVHTPPSSWPHECQYL